MLIATSFPVPAPSRRSMFSVSLCLLRTVVWIICVVISIGLWAFVTWAVFYAELNAIQQASLAAVGCFQVIVAYVVARAVDAMTR
jgi:hypothetical protein